MREILLVEDSAIDAEQAEAVFRTLGIKNPIRRFADGATAMQFLAALAKSSNITPPSVIFLDVKLPYVTGFEILLWMRDQPLFQQTLKIVFSTLDDTPTIKDGYFLGANSFLNKPVTADDLREVIKTYPQYWLIGSETPAAPKTS